MPKTNCNIIKDLLPSYADDLCSPESRQLVEEHFAECENCRNIYESGKEKSDLLFFTEEKRVDIKTIDYFKKVKINVSRKNMMMLVVVALLLFIEFYFNYAPYRFSHELPTYINYLFPIITAGILFTVLPDYAQNKVPGKIKYIVLSIEFVAITYMFVLLCYAFFIINNGSIPFGMEASKLGPFLGVQIHIITAGLITAFVLTLFFSIRKRSVCPAMHFLPLVGISMMLAFQTLLNNFDTRLPMQLVINPYLVFIGEVFLLVVIYMIVNRKKY